MRKRCSFNEFQTFGFWMSVRLQNDLTAKSVKNFSEDALVYLESLGCIGYSESTLTTWEVGVKVGSTLNGPDLRRSQFEQWLLQHPDVLTVQSSAIVDLTGSQLTQRSKQQQWDTLRSLTR
jgi:uncharacterized protein YggL (DUF469 family)